MSTPSDISSSATSLSSDVIEISEHDQLTGSQSQSVEKVQGDKRPVCRYGSECYRKNPDHLKEYSHPGRYLESNTCSFVSHIVP